MERNISKNVLLTGASGFIGSHMLEHLLVNTDWHITCIASWEHKGTPERILESKHYDPSRITVITHDLQAPLTDTTKKRIPRPDYILNFASDSHVDRSITDPIPFVRNNVDITLNMLEYARQVKPKMFVQISTDEVYGAAPDGVLHEEWSTILPSNPYSASKAAQEAIAISYWRTYGVPVVITNTMNNFGERQDPEKYIPKCIQKIAKGETLTIYGTEDNIGSRFYLHARNHADAVLFILNNLPPTKYVDGETDRPDRYNIVGEFEVDNLTVAKLIADILDKELIYELVDFHSARPGHDRRYALSGNKLKELGWKPPMPFGQSLRKTIQWTLENPLWL